MVSPVVGGEECGEEPGDGEPGLAEGRGEGAGRGGDGGAGRGRHQDRCQLGDPGHDALHGGLHHRLLPVQLRLGRRRVLLGVRGRGGGGERGRSKVEG